MTNTENAKPESKITAAARQHRIVKAKFEACAEIEAERWNWMVTLATGHTFFVRLPFEAAKELEEEGINIKAA